MATHNIKKGAAVALAFVVVSWLILESGSTAVGGMSVSRTLRVGFDPFGIAVNPSTDRVYIYVLGPPPVERPPRSSVVVLDGATSAVLANISVGYAGGLGEDQPISEDSSNGMVYLVTAGEANRYLNVIDEHTDQLVANVSLGGCASNIAVNPKTGMIYVAQFAQSNWKTCKGSPPGHGSVSVVDSKTYRILTNITLPVPGAPPTELAVDQSTNMLYTYEAASFGPITIINCTSNTIVKSLTFNDSIWSLVVNPTTDRIYATGVGARGVLNSTGSIVYERVGIVHVIDGTTYRVVANATTGPPVPLGSLTGTLPSWTAIDPVNNLLYGVDSNVGDDCNQTTAGTVWAMNLSTFSVESKATVGLCNDLVAIGVDSSSNSVYVLGGDLLNPSDYTYVLNGVGVISNSSSSESPRGIIELPFQVLMVSVLAIAVVVAYSVERSHRHHLK